MEMIAGQRRVTGGRGNGVERLERRGRPLRHTHSNRPIQRHDRRWRGLHQGVVKNHDPVPVSLFGSSGSHVTGGNGCLQSIISGFTT